MTRPGNTTARLDQRARWPGPGQDHRRLHGLQPRPPASNGTFHGIGAITHGFSNSNSSLGNLPVDLSSFGFGGCQLEISPDVALLLIVANGAANNSIAFPNAPIFTGIAFYSQVLLLDPLAPNGAGGMSNAVHGVLGQ